MRITESLPLKIRESFQIQILEAKKGKEGKEWEVVIIGPENLKDDVIVDGKETYVRSKNGRLYNVKGLEESVELWKDAKVYDNHLTDEEFIAKQGMRSVKDELVGVITDPEWIAEDYSIVAILKVIDIDLRAKLKEADEQDVLHTIGLSIDAIGKGERRKIKTLGNKEFHVIDEIVQALSVDIVAEPAAGGRLERMVASLSKQEGYTVDPKELKKLIEQTIKDALQPISDRVEAIEEALVADEEEATEEAEKLAAENKIDLAKGEIEGTGEDGIITEADVQKFIDAQAAGEDEATEEAAKLATEHKVDLAKSKIEGTGEKGIITEADVQKFIDAQAAGNDEPDAVEEAIEKIEKQYADKFKALDDKETLRESAAMLKVKLTDSGMPEDFQKILRARFDGEIFEEKDLETAIAEQTAALERLSESGRVSLPGQHITIGGVTPLDRYELAFLRMVAGSTRFNEIMSKVHQDPKGEDPYGADRFSESVKRYVKDGRPKLPRVLRLSEWYYDVTGDLDAIGVLNPEFMRVPEALVNTATVTSIVKNTLNLLLANDYSVRERWWEPIVRQEDVDTLDDATLVRVHGMNNLSGLSEGQTYTELDWEDAEEVASYKKRGNYVGITLETFLQDKLNVLRTIPMRLSNSWYNTVSALVSAVFTVNTHAGPVLSDTGALFNNTALTTGGGHANLLTGGLSYAEFLTIRTAMKKQRDQPLGVGRKLVDNRPKFLLIPVDILGIAEQIRDSELVPTQSGAATAGGEFQTRNSVRGSFEIIEVPDWTDVNNYAMVADPVRYPAIWLIWLRGRRTPELFSSDDERSGAMFSNDTIRMKIRMFGFRYSSAYDCAPVSDWRSLHKSNVT